MQSKRIELDAAQHIALINERGQLIRWALAVAVTVQSGGIALIASRPDVSTGDQVGMSCLLLGLSCSMLTGWSLAKALSLEASAIDWLFIGSAGNDAESFEQSKSDGASSDKLDRAAARLAWASVTLTALGGHIAIWL